MNNYNKARQKLTDMYVKSLEEGQIPWEKMWQTRVPRNGVSGINYRGINNLILSFIAAQRGYKDSRWCTYVQVSKHKWKLKDAKGQGVDIEYVGMKNKIDKKLYSFQEYQKIIEEFPEKENEFSLRVYNYKVFNADLIEGIPKEEQQEKNSNIITSDYINGIIKSIGVKYQEKGDAAYYDLLADTVVIPEANLFKNNYAYYATQLHELAHSTGHNSRLNRNMQGKFGTVEYAKEELRAEISSSFLMQNLGLEYDDNHLNNHKAYVQSWLKIIKDKPQELFSAILDANKIVSYLEEKSILKEKTVSKDNDIKDIEEEIEYEQ